MNRRTAVITGIIPVSVDHAYPSLRKGKLDFCACSTEPGLASSRSDMFGIPRFHVGDCDGDAFAKKLENLFRGAW